ncbi:MAG: DUF6624 domain-containing protein [Flavobacteriales bacterium]
MRTAALFFSLGCIVTLGWAQDATKIPELSDTARVRVKKEALVGFNMPLATLLDSIHKEDQQDRIRVISLEREGGSKQEVLALWRTIKRKDSTNLVVVRSILDKYGWLGADVVGSTGNGALFLVIQHSDLATQERYLPMIRDAVAEGAAWGSDLALLEDRVLIRQGKRQIYGRQIGQDEERGAYYLCPLDDARHVDERRAAEWLQPITNYLRNWNLTWDVEAYEIELPMVEERLRRRSLGVSSTTKSALDMLIIAVQPTGLVELTRVLQEGDLVFQDLDCGPLCDAIEAVTEGVDGKDFSHVAIAVQVDGTIELVEAIDGSVHLAPLDAFFRRSGKVIVGRPKGRYARIAHAAALHALRLIDVPYDDAFLPAADKLYCSEVVALAYERANAGVPVFPNVPMTFKDPATGKFFPAWVTYYDGLGTMIPEGVPGCNPGGLSRSGVLQVVWCAY